MVTWVTCRPDQYRPEPFFYGNDSDAAANHLFGRVAD